MSKLRSVFHVLLILSLALTFSGLSPTTASADVLTVNSVKKTALHTLIEIPTSGNANIKANLILLVGGNGVLKLNKNGVFKQKHGNFLTRSRHLFLQAGYLTALVDAPTCQDK